MAKTRRVLDYDRFRDFPDGEPGGFLEDRESIYSSNVIVFSCPFDGEHCEELHDIVTACKMQFGAKSVRLLATHPVCTSGWQDKLVPHDGPRPFDEIYFGNGRPRGRGGSDYKESTGGQVKTVDLAPVFADALAKIISGILNPS